MASVRRRAAVVAVVALAAVVAVGWAVTRPRVLEGPDGLLAVVTGPAFSGMDALAVGELVEGDGGCVSVRPPDGAGGEALVVFPWRTRLLDDGGRVGLAVPGRGEIWLGDEVELGGGFVQRPSGVPDGCGGGEIFLVSPR